MLCTALVCGLVSSQNLAAQPLEVNLRGLRGKSLTTSEVAQGNTLLVVWTTWSPRCRETIVERLNSLQGRWGQSARIFGVSFNEEGGEVESFLAGKNLSVPILLDADGSFSKKHAITTLPGLVVVQNGQVTYAGKLPDTPDALLSGLLK